MNNLSIQVSGKNGKFHLHLLAVSTSEKWKTHTLAQWIWRSSKDQELNYGSARITVTLSTRTLSTWTNHSLVIHPQFSRSCSYLLLSALQMQSKM